MKYLLPIILFINISKNIFVIDITKRTTLTILKIISYGLKGRWLNIKFIPKTKPIIKKYIFLSLTFFVLIVSLSFNPSAILSFKYFLPSIIDVINPIKTTITLPQNIPIYGNRYGILSTFNNPPIIFKIILELIIPKNIPESTPINVINTPIPPTIKNKFLFLVPNTFSMAMSFLIFLI